MLIKYACAQTLKAAAKFLMASGSLMELGFVEKPDYPDELNSPFYPSKVGGKPVWLELPSKGTLTCEKCRKPLLFLLQFQAPLPSKEKNGAENHRTLFLFMCKDPKCHSPGDTSCYVVLRYESREVLRYESREVLRYESREVLRYESREVCVEREISIHSSHDIITGRPLTLEMAPIPSCDTGNDCTDEDLPITTSTSSPIPPCDVRRGCVDEALPITTPTTKPSSDTSRDEQHHEDVTPVTTSNSSRKSCDDRIKSDESPNTLSLCIVCGGCGPLNCGSCRGVRYCSKHHQIHDWRSGHKQICSKLAHGEIKPNDIGYDPSLGVVLPELEIVTEDEHEICRQGMKPEVSEDKKMEDYVKYVEGLDLGRSECDLGIFEKSAKDEAKKDKIFRAFKKRIAEEPQQVYYTLTSFWFEMHMLAWTKALEVGLD